MGKTAIEVVLDMLFWTFNKVDMNFANRESNYRTYILDKILPTIKQMEIFDQTKFVAVALILDKKAFILNIIYLGAKILIYPAREAQMTLLLAKKISISKKYTDFSDVFIKNLRQCSLITRISTNTQ